MKDSIAAHRNSNIELLRIIAMSMVINNHFHGHGTTSTFLVEDVHGTYDNYRFFPSLHSLLVPLYNYI